MVRKFEGVESRSEVSGLRIGVDIRRPGQKLRDWWLTPEGQTTTFMLLMGVGILLLWAPLGAEFVLAMVLLYSRIQLRYKTRKWDFPLRVPMGSGLLDGSTNKEGDGLMLVGTEVGSRLPAYISDNDARTHALLFGTTGSGKTELLLAFVVNSLIYDGGASYTDGKGDVKLWLKFMNACRMFGREDDLLLISFITSGHEFYDRQENKISNTINMYANGSSGMCTEASIALMDSSKGGDDMWKGRAIAFLGGLIKPCVFLRDMGDLLLDPDMIRDYFDLPRLERFVWDLDDTWKGGLKRDTGYFKKKYGKVWSNVIRPLESFMVTIPGYDKGKVGKQEQKTLEQHGYITMQLARLFGDLADNYGHIMKTPLGEVDMYDVIINDRILVTLLPALERSPESLGMLGKIIVGGIKQMAAGCLGNKVEGLRREIVDARPTTSPVPFPTIFDEYGYYAVLGFSSMPAQARSLGFMVVFAAQDFASLKKSSPEEADQTWENTNLRGIGRITSGGGAETYKRLEELGGTVQVAEIAGFEARQTLAGTKLRASDQVKLERRPRVNHDDMHSQADGEFHLFLGKKEREGQYGRMKVIRVNGFYTETALKKDARAQPVVDWLAINHFARVSPPPEIFDTSLHPMIKGDNGLRKGICDGHLSSQIKTSESRAYLPILAAAMARENVSRTNGNPFGALDLTFAFMAFAPEFERVRKRGVAAALDIIEKPRELEKLVPTRSTRSGQASGGDGVGGGLVLQPATPVTVPVSTAAGMLGRPPMSGRPPGMGGRPPLAVANDSDAGGNSTRTKPTFVELSEQDRENLAKLSLFTDGAVNIPVNSATEEEIIALARDLVAVGAEMSISVQENLAEQAVDIARVEGTLSAVVKGLDKEAIVDVMLAVEPSAMGPVDTAAKRAEGRAFVEKMALGSSYLEEPIPQSSLSAGTFEDAVGMLAEAVIRHD